MARGKLHCASILLRLHWLFVAIQGVHSATTRISRSNIAGQWSIIEATLGDQLRAFEQPAQLESNAGDEHSSFIWPLPREHSHGNVTLVIDPGLKFSSNLPESIVLKAAYERYQKLIFTHPTKVKENMLRGNLLLVLAEVHIEVKSTSEEVRVSTVVQCEEITGAVVYLIHNGGLES